MKECIYLLTLPQGAAAEAAAELVATTHSPSIMPCWYYDKKDLKVTPSMNDGLTFETERRYRKEGARFIMNCGTNMGLGHNTMATGVVYFHRFYMFHSFKSFPRYVTACCCLFLAGKVEETPKKCRDIIKTARSLLTDTQFYSFGEDPKEEVMTLERILLQTIKFDLQVEHPYTFLLKYAKCFKGDQQKLQKMVQMAWNFVNDSLSTVVCLQWEPEIIAVALIHLASKLSKFTVVDWVGRTQQHLRWWDMFVSDVTMEILEDICHQVLDLYQSNQTGANSESNSPPQKPPSRAESPTTTTSTTTTTTTMPSKTSISPVTPAVATTSTTIKGNPICAIGSAIPSLIPSGGGSISSLPYLGSNKQQIHSSSMDHHETNNIPSSSAIKPLPPPPDPMAYLYPVNNWAPPHYPPPTSIGPSSTTVPPPLPPPSQMYGAPQFAPMTGHYSAAVPPPMPPSGHRAPPPPHPPQGSGGGGGSYYAQQQSQYGRQQRYPPSL